MRPETRRRLERWALAAALILANGSMVFGLIYHSRLIYSACKAVVIFAFLYGLCRLLIAVWDKNTPPERPETETIAPTMDVLEELDEKGIKVTYRPLDEQDAHEPEAGQEAGQVPETSRAPEVSEEQPAQNN